METIAITKAVDDSAPRAARSRKKGTSLRDIRGDLGDRAFMVQRQINAEHAQFETLIVQLKTEQERRLGALKAQLRAVNKLIDVAAWQYNVRSALLLATAVATAAETSAAATVEARRSTVSTAP
jgi:soluble lytic murein transglycosylase-like protein